MGIVGAVLIVGGLLPQYYEIWRLQEVKGISLIFLAIDCAGGVFSLLSLVFKSSFDGIAAANYIGIVVFELGIFGLYLVLNPRAKRRREEEKMQEQEASEARIGDGEQNTQATATTEATPEWSRHTTVEEKTPSVLGSSSNTQPQTAKDRA